MLFLHIDELKNDEDTRGFQNPIFSEMLFILIFFKGAQVDTLHIFSLTTQLE